MPILKSIIWFHANLAARSESWSLGLPNLVPGRADSKIICTNLSAQKPSRSKKRAKRSLTIGVKRTPNISACRSQALTVKDEACFPFTGMHPSERAEIDETKFRRIVVRRMSARLVIIATLLLLPMVSSASEEAEIKAAIKRSETPKGAIDAIMLTYVV